MLIDVASSGPDLRDLRDVSVAMKILLAELQCMSVDAQGPLLRLLLARTSTRQPADVCRGTFNEGNARCSPPPPHTRPLLLLDNP